MTSGVFMIAFDTETYLIQPGNLTPKLVCGSFHDGQETKLLSGWSSSDREILVAEFLRALKDGIVGANISYDLGVMSAYAPETLPAIFEALNNDKVYDVQLLEMLHDNATDHFFIDPDTKAPLKGYSLAYLETRHLGIDRSAQKEDGWRLRYAELDGVPLDQWPAEAIEYSRADAIGTWRVFDAQHHRACTLEGPTKNNWGCIHAEMRAAFALHLMSAWGIRTDELYVRKVSNDVRKLHEESRQKFLAAGLVKTRKARGGADPEIPDFYDVNGRGMKYSVDQKAVMARVAQAYSGKPPSTPSGRVSISGDTLMQSGDPLLEEFDEADKNETFFSNYLPVIELGTKVPVNARYRSILKTGRTSCSNPPLQTLPRKGPIREAFVPRPGWLFTSVDYGTQELVTLAQTQLDWFGHSALADALNAGQDVHIRMAAGFAGTTYEDFYARRKEDLVKKLRQASKPANFGLPGLLGPPGLVLNARAQYDVRFCEYIDGGECSDHERTTVYGRRTIAPTCVRCLELAVQIRERWLEEWPEMQDTLDICVRLFEDGECLPIPGTGMLVRATDKPGTFCNGIFQGRAAAASKRALYEVTQESYVGTGVLAGNCRPVVFLHDEILAEVREEVAHECAMEIGKIMISAMRKYTPDVLVKTEPAMARRWFKGMEPVYQDGRLIPWWPKDWNWEPDFEKMALDRKLAA
jgi:DNA polymerase-1